MCLLRAGEGIHTSSTIERAPSLPPSPLSSQVPRWFGCAQQFDKGDLSLSIQILTLFPDTASQKHRELVDGSPFPSFSQAEA